MPISIPAVMRKVAEDEVQRVLEFANLYEEKQSEELSRLQRLAGEEDDGAEFYADEAWLLDQLLTDAWGLATVSLYRVVELNTRKILSWRFGSGSPLSEIFRYDKLKLLLRRELDLDLDTVQGVDRVDLLRRANNAFKHTGKVDERLSVDLGAPAGSPLPRLDDVVRRSTSDVVDYLSSLAEEVVPKAHGGQRP